MVGASVAVPAQEVEVSEVIEAVAEELADDETDEEAVAAYTERLYELTEKPVRVNSSDEAGLSRLFFLTDFQVKSLADYVHSSGRIYSVFEIANIPGFDRQLAERLSLFISIDDKERAPADTARFNQNLLTNFSLRQPATTDSSAGSPLKMVVRYKAGYRKISCGFTSEKDSGEKLLGGKPPLPDFLSGYISFTGNNILKKVVIGDFSASYGLGTNVSSGVRTGLSLTAPGYMSGGDEIRPYTSTGENRYFRGAAVLIQLDKTSVSVFGSVHTIDASTSLREDSSGRYIESFYTSGLHSDSSSLNKKDAVVEYSFGIHVMHDFKKFRAGAALTENWFSLPVINSSGKPEDLHEFIGDRNYVASVYYKATAGRAVLYGEGSSSARGKLAIVQGLAFRPSDRLGINLLVRKYDPGFTSFHGQGPFSSSSGDNITGVFANFSLEAAKYTFLSAGCDLRHYPWMKYRCSAPSISRSMETKIKYIPPGKLAIEAAYNYRSAVLNDPESAGIKKQKEIVTHSLKFMVQYKVTDRLTLKTRLYYKHVGPSGSRGVLFLQDISFRFGGIPLTLWARHCLFLTDDWDSRIYAYENDLLYSFSVPALSGEGSRSCLMLSWKVKRFDLRIKYSDTESVQPGGSSKNVQDFRLQARLWF